MSEWCGWPIVGETTGWESAQQILTDAELSDGSHSHDVDENDRRRCSAS